MNIEPLADCFGADVSGIQIADVDDRAFAEIHAAWLERAVLRFRDQHIDDAALQAFSARIGPLEYAPMGKISEADRAKIANPFITTISNIIENGRPIGGLGSAEAAWHTDMSYIEHPPTASVLYAVEVPPTGGDTHFCDMRAALELLPDDLRARIATLRIKHDAAHNSVGGLRRGHRHADNPAQAPGAAHPIIRTHPETGGQALFLGRRQDAYVVGLELGESEALLDEIWSYVARPEHSWTQRWRVGDLVMWDNRSVMHRRAAFDPQSRRLMRRTQVRPAEAVG